ncbi:HK97 gp10 family phage protein [uncultured Sphingomonas sp.]|uniref:HK97 gp10 family phage protein n=1 Tax=uncultured Sphingomonas sp. TaxID=158754 RepID=UPI0025D2258F|nr:HK97 gp10 family phage protein [uncultured Sphingomonas sp.]
MPAVRGKSEVKTFMRSIPAAMTKVLQGAARAGGKVIAVEAKSRSVSDLVADAIVVRTRRHDTLIVVKVTVRKGFTYSFGTWLEWGTSGHYISVSDEDRQGLSVGKVNEKSKSGSLIIGGHFVGNTVWHPGARPHPFLRPAFDAKEADAIAAAQSYINARVTPAGIAAELPEEDAE